MFEAGNIQGRPSPVLFIKTALQVRTWNAGAGLASGVSSANYDLALIASSFEGTMDPGQMLSAITGASSQLAIIPATNEAEHSGQMSSAVSLAQYRIGSQGDDREDSGELSAAITSAGYELVIFNSTYTRTESATQESQITNANYAAT